MLDMLDRPDMLHNLHTEGGEEDKDESFRMDGG